MRGTVDRQSLLDAIRLAESFVASGSTATPLMKCVLLDAAEGSVTVTGADTEGRAWATVPVKDANGDDVLTAVEPGALVNFLQKCPEKTVTLDVNERRVSLAAGGSRMEEPTLDPEAYPPAPDFSAPISQVSLEGSELAWALQGCTYVPVENDLPWKTGIRIVLDGEVLAVMGSDGYRFGMRRVPLEMMPTPAAALLAAKPIKRVVGKLRDASTVRLVISTDGTWVLFDTVDASWCIRTLVASYPDLDRMTKADVARIGSSVQRKAFISTLEMAQPVATRAGGFVYIATEDATITVEASDGDSEVLARVPRVGDETMPRISVNLSWLIQAAQSYSGDEIRLRWGERAPIYVDEGEPDSAIAMVMPRGTVR